MEPEPAIEVSIAPKVTKAAVLGLCAVGVLVGTWLLWEPEAAFWERRYKFMLATALALLPIHQALFALGRTRLLVTLEGVRAELQTPFFGAMVWEEPLSAYAGVLHEPEAGGAKLVLAHKAFVLQSRNVTLGHHEGAEGGRAAAEALATRFGLPVLDEAVGFESLAALASGTEEVDPAPADSGAPFPPGALSRGDGAPLMIERQGRVRGALFAVGGSALAVVGVLIALVVAPDAIPEGWLLPALALPVLGFLGAAFVALRSAWRRERLVLEGGHLKRYEAKLGMLLLRQELDAQRVTALRVVPAGEGATGHGLSIQSGARELVVFRGEGAPAQLQWLASTLRARLDCEG